MGCTNHPAVEAGLQPCWVCTQPFCAECVVEFQGRTLCGPCKAAAVGRLEAGATDAVGAEGEPAPWERRAELGIAKAFIDTCKASMFEPVRFASRLDRTRQSYDCLVFAIVVQVLVAIVAAATNFVLFSVIGMSLPFQGASGSNPFMSGFMAGAGILGVVVSPVIAIVYAFLFSGAFHLALVVMKKATVPFHQTLRSYCYGYAPYVIGVVPLLGVYVGFVWMIVSQILLLKDRHRCSGGTAAIAVLWLFGLLICAGCALGAVLAGMLASRH